MDEEKTKCPNCFAIIPDNASKCPKCGASVSNDRIHEEPKAKLQKMKKITKAAGACKEGFFESIIDDDGIPRFLFKGVNGFEVVDEISINGNLYAPKGLNQIPYKPYGFCKEELPDVVSLFQLVRDEFDSFVDFEEIWKDVCAACVLLTYQQEKLTTTPYLYVYGDNESGKTTVLNVINALAYRPLFGVTIPTADLFGYLEDADCIPTILEDEIQGIHKDIDKLKIYKSGYKKGAIVPRTIMLEHDRIIKYYNVFCFKAVASEQIPMVKGFHERFIFIPMTEGYPSKEWADIGAEDFARFQRIRNLLLKWRLDTRATQLCNLSLPMKGRLKELWKPPLTITFSLPVYDRLLNFVESQRKERLSSKQGTLEGQIVKVVGSLYEGKEITFATIWDDLLKELEGSIDDRKPNRMATPDFGEITKQKVGYRLREVLNGVKKDIRLQDNGVVKVYTFDARKLARVVRKYGYEELVTKLLSLPSCGGVSTPEQDEKKSDLGSFSGQNDEESITASPLIPQQLGYIGNSATNKGKEAPQNHVENGDKVDKQVEEPSEELINYPYFRQELESSERSPLPISNSEKNPIEVSTRVPKTNSGFFYWKRVPPAEPCEQCGKFPVEYEVTTPEGNKLRKCPHCFANLKDNMDPTQLRQKE